MTTSSSNLALTVPATHRGAGKEAFAHISRDGSQAIIIKPLILDLSVKISRRVALLEASSDDPAQSSDDLAALAWIQRSLEDVEATIIGLSEVTAAVLQRSRVRPPLLLKAWFAKFRRVNRPPRSRILLTIPAGCRSSLPRHGHPACPKY